MLYLSAHQEFQERPFDLHISAYYDPNLPGWLGHPKAQPLQPLSPFRKRPMRQRAPVPFYTYDDPNGWQSVKYSAEIMLDMFDKKVEFKIDHEADVLHIFQLIDRYLRTLRPDIERENEKACNYALRVIAWRTELFKHLFRVLKQNPTWIQEFYDSDPEKSFRRMAARAGLRQKGSQSVDQLDPIQALAIPPVTVTKRGPSEDELRRDAEEDLKKQYGLSGMGENAADFDFTSLRGSRS